MPKPKKPAASDIVALVYSMPKHPRHDDLIEAAIRLLAAAVQNTASPDQPVSEAEALEGALAEFTTGLDALVFTGGIGEHAAPVRAAACENFGFLNLKLSPDKNAQSPADQDIATPDSAVRVLVVSTQEDWAIAQMCWALA